MPVPHVITRSLAAEVNRADVTFAQEMIPHHQQAIDMAQLAETRSQDEDVQRLAAQMESAQDPEIKTMTGWLETWGEDVPDHTSGAGHGDVDMPGMMCRRNEALESASGADFDRMFLEMMIKHHEGAIQMARTEQANGKNTDAIALAKQIEAAQTAEDRHHAPTARIVTTHGMGRRRCGAPPPSHPGSCPRLVDSVPTGLTPRAVPRCCEWSG